MIFMHFLTDIVIICLVLTGLALNGVSLMPIYLTICVTLKKKTVFMVFYFMFLEIAYLK